MPHDRKRWCREWFAEQLDTMGARKLRTVSTGRKQYDQRTELEIDSRRRMIHFSS